MALHQQDRIANKDAWFLEGEMGNKPYDVLEDGTIRFHEGEYEGLRSMFARADIDIDEITTEAEYQEAHSKAGDVLLAELFERAAAGESHAMGILRAFLEEDFAEAKALAARATFEVLPGGRGRAEG